MNRAQQWADDPQRYVPQAPTGLEQLRHCDVKECPRCHALVSLRALDLEERDVNEGGWSLSQPVLVEAVYCPVCDQALFDRKGWIEQRADQRMCDKLLKRKPDQGARRSRSDAELEGQDAGGDDEREDVARGSAEREDITLDSDAELEGQDAGDEDHDDELSAGDNPGFFKRIASALEDMHALKDAFKHGGRLTPEQRIALAIEKKKLALARQLIKKAAHSPNAAAEYLGIPGLNASSQLGGDFFAAIGKVAK